MAVKNEKESASKLKSKQTRSGKKKRKKKRKSKKTTAVFQLINNLPDDWDAFVKFKSEGNRPLHSILKSKKKSVPFLLWGLSDEFSDETRAFVQQCRFFKQIEKLDAPSQFVERLLQISQTEPDQLSNAPSLDQAVAIVACCHAFPKLLGQIPDDLAKSIFSRMVQFATDTYDSIFQTDPVVHQMLTGELPLSLSFVFPQIVQFDEFVDQATASTRLGVSELLDGNGLPKAAFVKQTQILAATWVRAAAICKEQKIKLFFGDSKAVFDFFLTQFFRLMRCDGSNVFTSQQPSRHPPEFLSSILEQCGDPELDAIASEVLPTLQQTTRKKKANVLPEPADFSEWSEIAVLQTGWTPKDASLVVDFSNASTRLELNRKETLLQGTWDISLEASGNKLAPQSDWSVVCWYSDNDCDYLELEMEFERKVKIQRQILLGRDEHFLFLADAVLCNEPMSLTYHSRLPLAPNLEANQSRETREIFLEGEQKLAAILPIGLPEWQIANSAGTFIPNNDHLELTQALNSSAYMPLFLDLDSNRILRPLTWRQLTVAHELKIESSDQAVGYRVQMDDSQWLFYRSLSPAKSRSLLGQHLFCDFFVGEFDLGGDLTEILTVG